MTAEKSHRFALTGQDPEGSNRTIILWQEAELVRDKVVRRVVLTLDATMRTATVLTPPASPRGGAGDPGSCPMSAPRTASKACPYCFAGAGGCPALRFAAVDSHPFLAELAGEVLLREVAALAEAAPGLSDGQLRAPGGAQAAGRAGPTRQEPASS